MNNPNPFVPKGSILEQQSKRRSRFKLAVFCVVAVSVTGLTAMLIQGCKREQPEETLDTSVPTIDTNMLATTDTNVPAMDTNMAPVVPPTVVTPPVVVPPEPATAEYVVVKGDTLDKIARNNHTTVKAIEAANPGVVPTKLKVGQKLTIPAGTGGVSAPTAAVSNSGSDIYAVKSGDTLTKIAKTHGTTVKAIQAANNMSTTRITVGQKLKIPMKESVAAPVVSAPEPAPAPVMPSPAPETVPAK